MVYHPQNSGKYISTDDLTLVAQAKTFDLFEKTLNNDLEPLNLYFKNWRLQPNPTKTEVIPFHLNDKMAKNKVNVFLDEQEIKNIQSPNLD